MERMEQIKIGDKVECIIDYLSEDYKLLLQYKLSSYKVYKVQEIIGDMYKVSGVKELVPAKFFKYFTPYTKDFLGNTLNVGDEVVYADLKYRELKRSKIIKMTDKTVFLEYSHSWRDSIKQSPSQLIKIV